MVPVIQYIRTAHKLGWFNVLYVIWYRISLKTGLRKRLFPPSELPCGTFYESFQSIEKKSGYKKSWKNKLIEHTNLIAEGKLRYFYNRVFQVDSPPQWFFNPFDQKTISNPDKHWTELGDFDLNIGDIKTIWEASRFYWLPDLARAYVASGEKRYLQTLNDWLNNWVEKNPQHVGPNWKCGQETSIRVMHLMLTAQILNQYDHPTSILQQVVWMHLQRIEPNINYALAQDNNHGTSETAALYIGSAWLLNAGFKHTKLMTFRDKGSRLLENRIKKLVQYDGTFSQYSVTYHRMVIDTISWVIWNEKKMGLNTTLNPPLIHKIEKALEWLEAIIDKSGDAPNFGSNDGSLICKLDSNHYRDFWPSIRLLKTLLGQPITSDKKIKDERLFWLNLAPHYKNEETLPNRMDKSLYHFPESGLVRMNGEKSWLLFHYPHYQFRPSHCDFLHVDLWHRGKNIFRDSGSYSYNTNQHADLTSTYFKSVQSHNTASFDAKEPIPKVSRFLYADWPRADAVKTIPDQRYCQARYRFGNHVDHKRDIQYAGKDTWVITDIFDGGYKVVELRWRLIPADWKITPDTMTLESKYAKIIVKADAGCEFLMEQGFESRYYMEAQKLPVLLIKGNHNLGNIETYIQLK